MTTATATEHATLAEALAAIRAELPAFQRTADNPFFNSKYVPLDDLIPGIVPVCLAHGVLLTGDVVALGPGYAYALWAVHVQSGQERASHVPLVGLTDAQKTLAGLTYAQRGALGIMFQLQIGTDDDGNTAAGNSTRTRTIPEGQPGKPQPAKGGAPTSRNASPAPSGTSNEKPCPRCGVSGFIRMLKSGKDQGKWRCMDWAEKGMNGCGATYLSDPRKGAPDDDGDPFRGL